MNRTLREICRKAQEEEFLGLPPKGRKSSAGFSPTSKRHDCKDAVNRNSDVNKPSGLVKFQGTGKAAPCSRLNLRETDPGAYVGISYPRYKRRMLCGRNPGATLRTAFPNGRHAEGTASHAHAPLPNRSNSMLRFERPASSDSSWKVQIDAKQQLSSQRDGSMVTDSLHDLFASQGLLGKPEQKKGFSHEREEGSRLSQRWRLPEHVDNVLNIVSRPISSSPEFPSRLPFLRHTEFPDSVARLNAVPSRSSKDLKDTECAVECVDQSKVEDAPSKYQAVSPEEIEILYESMIHKKHPVTEVSVRGKLLKIHHITSQLETESSGFGVGGMVWEPAIVLSRFLASSDQPTGQYLAGKHVLELGSGTGTAGLAAATLGATVTLTDLPKVLPLAAMNIQANMGVTGDVSLVPLDWGTASRWPQGTMPKFDIVLASDCIYASFPIPDLAKVLAELCSGGATLLWFWIRRHEKVHSDLWRELASKGLVVASLPIEELGGSRCLEAYVGCLRGRHLDPVVAKPAIENGSFFFTEDGAVQGVRTEDTPTSGGQLVEKLYNQRQ